MLFAIWYTCNLPLLYNNCSFFHLSKLTEGSRVWACHSLFIHSSFQPGTQKNSSCSMPKYWILSFQCWKEKPLTFSFKKPHLSFFPFKPNQRYLRGLTATSDTAYSLLKRALLVSFNILSNNCYLLLSFKRENCSYFNSISLTQNNLLRSGQGIYL